MIKLFNRKPKWNKEHRHIIVPAFKWKGVQYYQLDDYMNIPCKRALEAIRIYEEFNNRASRSFMLAKCDEIDSALNSGLLTEAARINRDIKDRLNMVYSPDLVINLASIIYFDDNEDPLTYEVDYNKRKVSAWREGGLDPFFSQLPLSELMPSLDFSKIDSQMLTSLNRDLSELTIAQIDEILLGKCSTLLSLEQRSELEYQKEILQDFLI